MLGGEGASGAFAVDEHLPRRPLLAGDTMLLELGDIVRHVVDRVQAQCLRRLLEHRRKALADQLCQAPAGWPTRSWPRKSSRSDRPGRPRTGSACRPAAGPVARSHTPRRRPAPSASNRCKSGARSRASRCESRRPPAPMTNRRPRPPPRLLRRQRAPTSAKWLPAPSEPSCPPPRSDDWMRPSPRSKARWLTSSGLAPGSCPPASQYSRSACQPSPARTAQRAPSVNARSRLLLAFAEAATLA